MIVPDFHLQSKTLHRHCLTAATLWGHEVDETSTHEVGGDRWAYREQLLFMVMEGMLGTHAGLGIGSVP